MSDQSGDAEMRRVGGTEMRACLAVVTGFLAWLLAAPAAATTDPPAQLCLPQWANEALLHKDVAERLELVDILARPVAGACNIAPWFVEGDFNGDGKSDVAVRGRDRKSGAYGVLIVHDGEWKLYGIGFQGPDAGGETGSYRLSHLRTRRGVDGKDVLVVTPFKHEPDDWRWTGATYERGEGSTP